MTAIRANIEFAKRIFSDRLGDPYVYGGTWNPFDLHAGCDCSGEVTDVLGAVYFGTAMHWDREGLSTESYRYKPMGMQTVGPFAGLVHVAAAKDIPDTAAVKIALHHEGEGGPDSHMWCEVDGVLMETNGSLGTIGAPKARTIADSYANDWWYLPGPIVEDGTAVTVIEPVDTLFADVSEFQVGVNDSYPYRVLSIRSNDGTYKDHNFAENYAWCVKAADANKLDMFIVYFYWRVGNGDVQTIKQMVAANGGPHPKMVVMMDVESGGNPGGDESGELNAEYQQLASWLGDPRRVIAYANLGDAKAMWNNHPDVGWILAGYGANPSSPLFRKLAHQYTDGQGYGGGLPEGCPPFGHCDMNSADGLSPTQFAAVCGIASTASGGFLMALTDAQQQQIYDKITTVWGSRSAFRHWGEGPIDDTVGIELNDDGMEHVQLVIKLAEYGDPAALALLHEVANGDLAIEPGRAADKALAQRVLDRLASSSPVAPTPVVNAPTVHALAEPAPVAVAPTEAVATPAAPKVDVAQALAQLASIFKSKESNA